MHDTRFTIHDRRSESEYRQPESKIYDTSGLLSNPFDPVSSIPGLAPRSGARIKNPKLSLAID